MHSTKHNEAIEDMAMEIRNILEDDENCEQGIILVKSSKNHFHLASTSENIPDNLYLLCQAIFQLFDQQPGNNQAP